MEQKHLRSDFDDFYENIEKQMKNSTKMITSCSIGGQKSGGGGWADPTR